MSRSKQEIAQRYDRGIGNRALFISEGDDYDESLEALTVSIAKEKGIVRWATPEDEAAGKNTPEYDQLSEWLDELVSEQLSAGDEDEE